MKIQRAVFGLVVVMSCDPAPRRALPIKQVRSTPVQSSSTPLVSFQEQCPARIDLGEVAGTADRPSAEANCLAAWTYGRYPATQEEYERTARDLANIRHFDPEISAIRTRTVLAGGFDGMPGNNIFAQAQ